MHWPLTRSAFACLAVLGRAGVAGGVLTSACADPVAADLPDDQHWQSEHFDYYTRDDDPSVCPAVLDTLERHLSVLQAQLGFSLGERIDYRKFRDGADVAASHVCDENTVCTLGTRVHTNQILDEHELVHAYLDGTGDPPALFEEGVAEALSCGGALPAKPDPISWQAALALSRTDPELYQTGQWFVGYLLHTYGPEPFLAFYAGDFYDATADQVSARFASAYGLDLDAEWQRAFEQSEPKLACVPVWACASSPLPIDGSAVSLAPSCDASADYLTLTQPAPGLVELTTQSDMLSSIALSGCGVDTSFPSGDSGTGYALSSLDEIVELETGAYFLARNSRPASLVAHALSKVDKPCIELVAPPAVAGYATLWTLTLLQPAEPFGVRLGLSEPARFYPIVQGLTLDRCPACDSRSDECEPLTSKLALHDGDGLRIASDVASPDGYGYATLGITLAP
jgi:hypothetical protein